MNNTRYKVRQDFLPVREGLRELPEERRRQVEGALRILETDPRPESLECTRVHGDYYKITVAGGEERLSILYRVDDESKDIDLVRIKPVGALRRTLDWLSGLLDYTP